MNGIPTIIHISESPSYDADDTKWVESELPYHVAIRLLD